MFCNQLLAAAVLTGCPAVPTISITMQGCTPVRGQWPIMAVAVWAGLIWMAGIAWHTRRLRWLALAVVIVHPLVTWNDEARQLFIILGGHLGELVFAGVALWRARTGGFTDNPAERMLYGVVGWYLVFRNAWMCGGLIWDADERAIYYSSGSYGMVNDYIVVAEQVLGWSLEAVAGMMLSVTLAVFPLSLIGKSAVVGRLAAKSAATL